MRPGKLVFACSFLLFISPKIVLAADAQQTNFRPWSENFFLHIEKEYGAAGANRLRKLHDLIVKNIDKPVREKLQVTNDALNRLPWLTDREKYKQDDYWATPLETITTFGGDCEDIAIAKYMMLRVMGIPAKNLFLAYAKIKKTGEAHMVLVYIDHPDKPADKRTALVLDNYVKEILPGKDRNDLLAVYLVDAERNVTVLNDDGNSREVKKTIKDAKYAKLETIKKKIRENYEASKAYNDGRPLY
jgi:predicted transglutaminase-like cysteine proteinase